MTIEGKKMSIGIYYVWTSNEELTKFPFVNSNSG